MRDVARMIAVGSLLIGLFGPAAAPAQDGGVASIPASTSTKQRGELPEAAELFERYIEAIGGKEKVFSLKNRRIRGTFAGEPFEFRANLKVWWEADGRFHQSISEPAGLRYNIHANGEHTWVVVHDKEPRFLGGMQRVELLDTADFFGEANYEKRYKEIKTVGSAMADDRPVYVVRALTHLGRPHTLYFDQENGLLVGTRVPTFGEGGRIIEMMIRIGDYKEFGGVLYPTRLQQQFVGSEKKSEYRYIAIEVNADDEHDYSVPEIVAEQYQQALKNDAEKAAKDAAEKAVEDASGAGAGGGG